MNKLLIVALATGLLTVTAATGFADSEKAAEARRDYYGLLSFHAAPLFGMLKGQVEYDAKAAQVYADNLKLLTEVNTERHWEKGSDNANPALKGKTRALPAAFEDGSDVLEKHADLVKAVADLASVAGSGKEAMVEKMKAVGAACGACHKSYRAKDF